MPGVAAIIPLTRRVKSAIGAVTATAAIVALPAASGAATDPDPLASLNQILNQTTAAVPPVTVGGSGLPEVSAGGREGGGLQLTVTPSGTSGQPQPGSPAQPPQQSTQQPQQQPRQQSPGSQSGGGGGRRPGAARPGPAQVVRQTQGEAPQGNGRGREAAARRRARTDRQRPARRAAPAVTGPRATARRTAQVAAGLRS